MVAAGVIGYVFHLVHVPLTPLVLAIILGPMLEENFQRSLALSRGDWGIFVSSPISIALLIVCILSVVLGAARPLLAAALRRRHSSIPSTPRKNPQEITK